MSASSNNSTNVRLGQGPPWRRSASAKVRLGKGPPRRRSASAKVRLGKGPPRQRSASAKVSLGEGLPWRRSTSAKVCLGKGPPRQMSASLFSYFLLLPEAKRFSRSGLDFQTRPTFSRSRPNSPSTSTAVEKLKKVTPFRLKIRRNRTCIKWVILSTTFVSNSR
jgi:hypothetical protein